MKEKFSRSGTLFLQYLKRDWKKIIFWITGLGLFSAIFVPAFEEIAKGQGLQGMYETMQNPAMTAMVGPTPVDSAAEYTVGAMYTHEMLLFCGVVAMIISALHVVSHTRKEEDLGLTELVRSFQVGRQANSLAVLLEVTLINTILAAVISVIMMSFNADGFSVSGTVIFGTSIGAAGLIGAVIALAASQLMPSSSGATGLTLGIIGLMYIIRAGTDTVNTDLSMLNPMGWTYLSFPFTENDVMPFIYTAAFLIIVSVIAFTLEGYRDMGAGYLPERAGHSQAGRMLLSVPGWFFRINRSVIISWMIGFIAIGAAYGSIYGDMQSFIESNAMIQQMFTATGVSIEVSFTGTIMAVVISLVSILPIVIVNKLYNEETRQHLSQIYATKVSRAKLFFTAFGLAVTVGFIGTLISALGLGLTALGSMGSTSVISLRDFINSGLNFFPVVLFFTGISSLLLGWLPKFGKLVYIVLVYSFFLDYFQGILDLPEWIEKTAVQSFMPRVPLDPFEWGPFLIITGISIFLMLLGYIGYKRRDLA